MSDSRDKLTKNLDQYISDTFSFMKTVKNFISRSSEWIRCREAEALKLTRGKCYESEEKLEKGLQPTLKGLKQMQMFLDAVETLALTSVCVFEQNQVLQFSNAADLNTVQKIIFVAQLLCPLLLSFKRDNEAFFKPKLENIEVMQFQLNQYITNTKQICDGFKKCFLDNTRLDNIMVALNEGVSEDDIEKMLSNMNKLNKYRTDEDSRLLFLFQNECEPFMKEFKERKNRIQQFLREAEACAVQLDSMKKGAQISGVVGSSVGAVSGVMSIVGFALIPFTAGASLTLIGVGAGLSGLSAVNSIVTSATESGVNHTQKKKADEIFEKFMEDVNVLQKSLNEVLAQHFFKIQRKFNLKQFLLSGPSISVVKSIDTIVDCISAVEYTAETSEVAQAALRGPLAMSKAVRGGLIALNAVFIGVDLFVIVKDGIALSKGSGSDFSRYIRARAALWKTEIVSWQKMSETLEKCSTDFEKMQAILTEPFY